MNRNAVLGVLALLVVAALVFSFVEFGGGPSPVGPGGSGAQTEGPAGAALAEGGDTGRATGGAVRKELPGGGVDGEEYDPDLEAARCGFRGRVVSAQGTPIAGCGVRIYRLALDSILKGGGMSDLMAEGPEFEPQILGGEADTGDDGRFLIDGVWPRAAYVMLAGIGTDNPTHRVVQRTPGPGEIVDLGDVVLEDAAVFVGRVVDQAGSPVPGALVWAADIPGQIASFVPLHTFDPKGFVIVAEQAPFKVLEMPSWVERVVEELPVPKTRTDSDGAFRLVGVKPGANMVAISKAGLLPMLKPNVRAKAGEEKDLGRNVLRDGEELVGRVVDSKGDPIADAEIIAGPKIPIAPIPVAHAVSVGKSQADGSFFGLGFPPGDVLVAARRGPGHGWVLSAPTNVNQDVEVVLPAQTRLVVRVTNQAGEILERPRLKIVPGQRGDGGAEMMLMGFVKPIDLRDCLEQGEDGAQEITGLIPGKYMVLADAPGHAVAAANIDLSVDEDAEISIGLIERIVHNVYVTDWEGKPVRGASIYAQGRGEKVSDIPVDAGRTGADGRRAVDKVETEQVRISAEHPAYGVVHGEHSSGEPELVLRFEQPGSIEGVLLDNGRPPELGKWSVVAMRRGSTRGATESVPPMASPDGSGRFVFRALQPGRYRLTAVDFVQSITSPGSMMNTMMAASMQRNQESVEVEVPPGGVGVIEFDTAGQEYDGPGARVTGTVFVNGQPAKGATLQGWSEAGPLHGTVDEYGGFDMGKVPVGKHRITVIEFDSGNWFSRGGRSEIHAEEVEIEDGADKVLDIRVDTGGVNGFVTTPDGSALEGVVVASLRGDLGAGGDVRLNTEVDARGRFSFEKVPVGDEYSLEVRALGDKPYRKIQPGVVVSAGLMTNVQVVLEPTFSISGRVDLTVFGDTPTRRMWLQFERTDAEGEGQQGNGRIDSDGTFSTRDGIAPGTYKVSARSWSEGATQLWVSDVPLVVTNRNLEDVVLVMRKEQPNQGGGP